VRRVIAQTGRLPPFDVFDLRRCLAQLPENIMANLGVHNDGPADSSAANDNVFGSTHRMSGVKR
jgi:hypothetical protein